MSEVKLQKIHLKFTTNNPSNIKNFYQSNDNIRQKDKDRFDKIVTKLEKQYAKVENKKSKQYFHILWGYQKSGDDLATVKISYVYRYVKYVIDRVEFNISYRYEPFHVYKRGDNGKWEKEYLETKTIRESEDVSNDVVVVTTNINSDVVNDDVNNTTTTTTTTTTTMLK